EREIAEPDALEVLEPRHELAPRELPLPRARFERREAPPRFPDLERVERGDVETAHAKRERGRVQTAPTACRARVVRAVAREQHAHVQLVRLRLEPAEPAEHAGEATLVPAPVSLQHELLLGGAEAGERDIGADAVTRAELEELGALPAGGSATPRPNGALRERPLGIGNHLGRS